MYKVYEIPTDNAAYRYIGEFRTAQEITNFFSGQKWEMEYSKGRPYMLHIENRKYRIYPQGTYGA